MLRAKGEKWSDLLLAPDAVDYAFSEYFMFDFTTGAISPTPGIAPDKKERAQTTIDRCGLHREPRRRLRLVCRLSLRESSVFPLFRGAKADDKRSHDAKLSISRESSVPMSKLTGALVPKELPVYCTSLTMNLKAQLCWPRASS